MIQDGVRMENRLTSPKRDWYRSLRKNDSKIERNELYRTLPARRNVGDETDAKRFHRRNIVYQSIRRFKGKTGVPNNHTWQIDLFDVELKLSQCSSSAGQVESKKRSFIRQSLRRKKKIFQPYKLCIVLNRSGKTFTSDPVKWQTSLKENDVGFSFWQPAFCSHWTTSNSFDDKKKLVTVSLYNVDFNGKRVLLAKTDLDLSSHLSSLTSPDHEETKVRIPLYPESKKVCDGSLSVSIKISRDCHESLSNGEELNCGEPTSSQKHQQSPKANLSEKVSPTPICPTSVTDERLSSHVEIDDSTFNPSSDALKLLTRDVSEKIPVHHVTPPTTSIPSENGDVVVKKESSTVQSTSVPPNPPPPINVLLSTPVRRRLPSPPQIDLRASFRKNFVMAGVQIDRELVTWAKSILISYAATESPNESNNASDVDEERGGVEETKNKRQSLLYLPREHSVNSLTPVHFCPPVSTHITSWRNGLALCLIIHSKHSSLIPIDELNACNEKLNRKLAFECMSVRCLDLLDSTYDDSDFDFILNETCSRLKAYHVEENDKCKKVITDDQLYEWKQFCFANFGLFYSEISSVGVTSPVAVHKSDEMSPDSNNHGECNDNKSNQNSTKFPDESIKEIKEPSSNESKAHKTEDNVSGSVSLKTENNASELPICETSPNVNDTTQSQKSMLPLSTYEDGEDGTNSAKLNTCVQNGNLDDSKQSTISKVVSGCNNDDIIRSANNGLLNRVSTVSSEEEDLKDLNGGAESSDDFDSNYSSSNSPSPKKDVVLGEIIVNKDLIERTVTISSSTSSLSTFGPIAEIREELLTLEKQVECLNSEESVLRKLLREEEYEHCLQSNGDGVEEECKHILDRILNLVNQKNEIVRRQMQLNIKEKDALITHRHASIVGELQRLSMISESRKTEVVRNREKVLLEELVCVVNDRDELVQCLDRQEQAVREDEDIKSSLQESRRDAGGGAAAASVTTPLKKCLKNGGGINRIIIPPTDEAVKKKASVNESKFSQIQNLLQL